MNLDNKTVVVTGGARGIGKALSIAFAAQGAKVVVADLEQSEALACADTIDGTGISCDVSCQSDIRELVVTTEQRLGPIDLFCSNAGVCFGEPSHSASASDEVWQTCWDVHVMAHVYAARAVLPSMIDRGGGYFVNMASAAGLLSQIGDAAYSASKHAAVGFAESLAISHSDDGIKVSVVCPEYVATPMLGYPDGAGEDRLPGLISPEEVADAVVKGIEAEQFLIVTHPETERFFQSKSRDYDRWLGGMRKLRRKIVNDIGTTKLQDMHRLV